MFELRDLECFLTVAEQRNFGRAAAALGIAQPALSRRIANLERDLGVALFSRARRQIELTPAGELLQRDAQAVLAQAALAERRLREAARGSMGHLRLGTRSLSRFALIPRAIRLLRATHPGVTVTVVDPLVALHLDYVRRGTIDMTVARGPVKLDGDLQCERLRSDPLVVALPEGHRLAGHRVVEVRDLAGEDFIEFAWFEAFIFKELARAVCARAGFVPRVVEEADSTDSLLLCVAAAGGVALIHDVDREVRIPGIVYRRIHPAEPPIDLYAVWRRGDPNPIIPPFVECIAAVARARPSARTPVRFKG
jgi:DNA-binding transcriptional LysR family regulator